MLDKFSFPFLSLFLRRLALFKEKTVYGRCVGYAGDMEFALLKQQQQIDSAFRTQNKQHKIRVPLRTIDKRKPVIQ